MAGVAWIGLGADCDPAETADIAIYATTGPPPSAEARIEHVDGEAAGRDRVVMSPGAVFAVRCWDTCDFTCVDASFTVADPDLLSVVPVERPSQRRPEFALVAHAAGLTLLTVETACAEATYAVEIE